MYPLVHTVHTILSVLCNTNYVKICCAIFLYYTQCRCYVYLGVICLAICILFFNFTKFAHFFNISRTCWNIAHLVIQKCFGRSFPWIHNMHGRKTLLARHVVCVVAFATCVCVPKYYWIQNKFKITMDTITDYSNKM